MDEADPKPSPSVGCGILYEQEFVEDVNEEMVNSESEEDEDIFFNTAPKVKRRKLLYEYPISKQSADLIYKRSGSLVKPVDSPISVHPKPLVFLDHLSSAIENVRLQLKVDYQFNDMQVMAMQAIGNGHDVMLNAPCGSGKMMVFFAGVLLLRKVKQMPQGFGIILEPLVAISEENQKSNPPLPVAFMDMTGEVKISDNILDVSEDKLKDISEGKVACVFMSAEAALSQRGLELVKSWRKSLLLVCTDEAQLYTEDQWGARDFRVDMSRAPGTQ
jgi:superfamily II DNA helicase RecQ